jgi:hypothetical protein
VGAILLYVLFCGVVILGVVTAMLAGYPVGPVAQFGVWAVSGGAIAAVLYRFLKRRA